MSSFAENLLSYAAQTMKFSIKDFCSKCGRIWSHLLKKSLMENFIFCALLVSFLQCVKKPLCSFLAIVQIILPVVYVCQSFSCQYFVEEMRWFYSLNQIT